MAIKQEKEQDYEIIQQELKISVPLANSDREAVRPGPSRAESMPSSPAERELLTPAAGASGCQASLRFKVIQGVFGPEVPFPITPRQVK